MADHKVVSRDQWLEARKSLLAKEKQFTRLREELSQERRELPWEAVSKNYVFEGPDGNQSLSELFDGRSQLIVYHFMFGPDWDAGCPHCSFWADSFNEVIVHLNQRDVTMIAVSRAPYSKLAAYRKRMGWNFKWVSSHGADFNFDYQVSFTPEEVAGKKALYNFGGQPQGAPSARASACSIRMDLGTYFTPIPLTRAASTSRTPRTTTLTWFQRVATSGAAVNTGCADAMNTPPGSASIRYTRTSRTTEADHPSSARDRDRRTARPV